MITERTLKKWRKEALIVVDEEVDNIIKHQETIPLSLSYYKEINDRILRLTQILLDQHLLRK